MMIVLLVLLMTMTTAGFAIHATASEIRAAGHLRQALQTQHIAETGVVSALGHIDQHGPQALLAAMAGQNPPPMQPYEPALASGKQGFRIFLDDLGDQPPTDAAALGQQQVHRPFFLIDVNDHYTFTGTVPGEALGGRAPLRFLHATYTARGRTQVPGEQAEGVDARAAHEGAADARAFGLSGPF
ncbi:MAG: hypothetical protein ACPGUV_08195 [Polyangiales bacterium]